MSTSTGTGNSTSTIDSTTSTVTTRDGTAIHYKDWGQGTPVVFSHGWPLQGDAWEDQMLFLAEHGYRVIAHDRRGHGFSGKPWDGNHMDTYADDLATLLDTLDLRGAVLVGHSTGGGEVTRYIGRHGTARVAKAVLISAVPPQMLRTDSNPEGLPMDVFDAIRAGVLADRSQYFRDLALPFYGYNRPGAAPSQGVIDTFWLQGMQCSIRSAHACIAQFSETDFTADLAKMTIPPCCCTATTTRSYRSSPAPGVRSNCCRRQDWSCTKARRTASRPRTRSASTPTCLTSCAPDRGRWKRAGHRFRRPGVERVKKSSGQGAESKAVRAYGETRQRSHGDFFTRS